MLRLVIALVLSLAIVLLIGPWLLKKLRELKFGQTIYELGPAHQQKQGTPIMGGFMFMISSTVAALACHAAWGGVWDFTLALLVFCWVTMITGFLDDYTKVTKKRNLGLTPKQKIAIQVISALAFSTYCYFNPNVGSVVKIPFFNVDWNFGIFYIPLMTLLCIFIVNSANLQDGLDGLLGSVTATSSVGWAATAMILAACAAAALPEGNAAWQEGQYLGIAVFAAALCGGAIGYLKFNLYPAKVFMGDTGSMFIGGAMVGMAMLLRQPFLLLFMAFCPIMSSLSVMLQVGYFKYTKKKYGEGRRIFKMSPIHHHFEKCGWSELKIVGMYAAITASLSLIAALGMYLTVL